MKSWKIGSIKITVINFWDWRRHDKQIDFFSLSFQGGFGISLFNFGLIVEKI